MASIDTSPVPVRPARSQPAFTPVIPAPEPYKLPKNGRAPDFTWEFRQPDGGLAFVVTRYNASGDEKKRFIPWTYDGTAWQPKGLPGTARPLYNAPLLASSPSAPVLIVEGERTADAASAYVPKGWIVTTWHGGAQAVERSDWSTLRGHPCVIWRDNDAPGVQAQIALEDILSGLGIAYEAIKLPRWLPDGWDLGDPLPEKWSAEKVRAQIAASAASATVKVRQADAAPPAGDAPAPNYIVDDAVAPVEGEREYECLGHDETNTFYFISRRSRGIVAARRREVLTGDICRVLVPDETYWSRQYGGREGIPWKSVGTHLVAQCMAKGFYSPARLRGRGVWLADGRVLAHLGDRVVVDGVVTEPASIVSHYVYPQRAKFMGGVGRAKPLTDDIGRQFRAACRLVRWEKDVYGDLLAGWIAIGPICGALPWRPHIWVTAPAGTGKTFVLENIIAWAISPMFVFAKGATTAAGLRGKLRADALPVIYDEAEANGLAAEQRMQGILQFARNASQEGDAHEYKGTQTHDAVEFEVRSSLCASSIRVPLDQAADISRFSVLTMRKAASDTEQERADNEAHFAKLRAALAALPSDFSQRLISRQILNVQAIRATVELFSEQVARLAGDRRLGQQLGTLITGCWSLVRHDVPTVEEAQDYVRRFNWSEFNEAKDAREDMDIFRYLSSRLIKFSSPSGKMVERSLGEVCAVAASMAVDDSYVPAAAEKILNRFGLRFHPVVGDVNGFALALKHDQLDELMGRSQYSKGWRRIIARHPQATTGDRDLLFGALRSPYVWVPAEVMVGSGRD